MLNVLTRFPSARPNRQPAHHEMGRTVKALRISSGATAGLLLAGRICLAQPPEAPPVRREFETRAELEALAKQAETQHRTGEAWLLKQRLEHGDFQDGDRILFKVLGNTGLPTGFLGLTSDTLIVRAGRKIELPRLADLSLDGVLRSELNQRLTEHVAQYIKEASVRSVPLVRLAILGAIGRPGYLYTSADAPLSDVLMQAGGPGGNADMKGVTIRRGDDIIWNAQDTQAALADGMSVDRLHLRAGDEVYIPEQSHFPWLTVFTVGLSSVALLLNLLRR